MPRIKKEDEFYTMLKEFAALIVEAADEYNRIICEFPESMSSIPQMINDAMAGFDPDRLFNRGRLLPADE